MATVKTAISVEKERFRKVDELARRTGLSRSKLFSRAMESYLSRQAAEDLRRRIDAAHADGLDEEDRAFPDVAGAQIERLNREVPW